MVWIFGERIAKRGSIKKHRRFGICVYEIMDDLIDPNWSESAEPSLQFYWSIQEGKVDEIRARLQPGGIYHDLINISLNSLALACHYDHPNVVRLLTVQISTFAVLASERLCLRLLGLIA